MSAQDEKLLLVDNELSILEAVGTLLTTMDFDVVTAASGAAAVEAFKLEPAAFRWAVVDLAMPVMDGIETVRQLRAIAPSLAVVIATGYADRNLPEDFLATDRTALIQKPYRGKTIEKLLHSL